MSDLTAGYSFIVEFAQSGVNKIVRALFSRPGQGVQTRFEHGDPGQPGLLSTRDSASGRFAFQRYLFEGMIGYEVFLYDPAVRLIGGSNQQIELSVGFDFTLFRQLLVRKTEDALAIPADPASVDPDGSYLVAFDSGLQPEHLPGTRGRLLIVLNLTDRGFGAGNRVTIDATRSSLASVVRVDIQDIDWPVGFEDFVETVAAKAISTLLRSEIREIDVTSQFGVFNTVGVKLREPLQLRIGRSHAQPSLAIAMHEWSLVDDGRPSDIVHEAGGADYATQIDEGFFILLVAALQNAEVIKRRFNTSGEADVNGAIRLHNIRLSFEGSRMRIQVPVDYRDSVNLFVETFVRLTVVGNGTLALDLEETRVHVQLLGFLGGIQRLLNTLTFHLFDAMISDVLGNVFEAQVEHFAGATLHEFLGAGRLGFAFKSPIRNTDLVASLMFTEFAVVPGRALIRGNLSIEEA